MHAAVLVSVVLCGAYSLCAGQCLTEEFTYHDHAYVTTYLECINEQFPEITEVNSIGTSVQGKYHQQSTRYTNTNTFFETKNHIITKKIKLIYKQTLCNTNKLVDKHKQSW